MEAATKKPSVFTKNLRVLRLLWRLSKSYFFTSFGEHILKAFLPYVALYGANLLIDGISGGKSLADLMVVVYWMAGIICGASILMVTFSLYNQTVAAKLEVKVKQLLSAKTFALSYAQCEDFDTMRLVAAADEGSNGTGGLSTYMESMASMVEGITSIVFGLIFLAPLFQAAAVTASDPLPIYLGSIWAPLTIIGLALLSMIITGAMLFFSNTMIYHVMMKNVENNRHYAYFYQVSVDYQTGKDIRLYHMAPFIEKLQSDPKAGVNANWNGMSWAQFGFKGIDVLMNALLACGAYLIVGYRASYGFGSIGSVVAMVGAAGLLSNGLNSLLGNFGGFTLCANYLQNYFLYLNLPSSITYGDEELDLSQPITIEFKDVHFTYPGQKNEALKGLNLRIEPGKRLAIVGLNGAGKTTLVKLLCRYYDPDSGTILVNGKDIKAYREDAIYQLYAVVFQDFKIFSYSVRDNLYCGLEGDEAKAVDALKRAGIYDRVKAMPKGLDTLLYQDNEENGIEISGGEAQKLAIARALYKDSPIVILDEPTAALDPKSEAEIYDDFAGLIKGKTALFISHRMSSTRDSDTIAVIADGVVKELGNHKALMKNPNGLYHQMWDAQAQYYK
jgi:ATP-binding cassette subfamily B protein